ncbi:MAG TPA: hypothetical protein PLP88_09475 [Bacteroidales bacterium]|nr:hypothetical protein [Bacteroidales bacterium]
MIAANIGKIFLDAYNEKFKSNCTAKEFFVEIYHKLFFDHNKYMMSAGNSPLENPKISWDKMRTGQMPYETVEKRYERFSKTIEKIDAGPADASIAIGFPSLDYTATTSGQVTNLDLPIKTEEIYLSWIGSGLGIGVQSGLSLLFSNKQILLDLFDGWQVYRDFLNKIPTLRGNQINTWNGQWLAHRYDKYAYDASNPTASFNPFGTMKDGGMEIYSQSWTKVLVGIARAYPETSLTAYVYSLGQMNITVGFVPFELPRIRQPFELYEKYFGTTRREQVELLFGTAMGFTKACQMGAVGVNALEPKGFRECLDKGVIPKYNPDDEEKTINYNTYQIWLLAMLNNEQLWEKALQIAATLNNYSLSDKNARKVKSQEVANLLASVNKKQFIESLSEIVKGSPETDQLAKIASLVHSMPVDNVSYFLTLIRFQYAVVNKKS